MSMQRYKVFRYLSGMMDEMTIKGRNNRMFGANYPVCTLVWEEGNHFTDNEGRLARAFAWCMERL